MCFVVCSCSNESDKARVNSLNQLETNDYLQKADNEKYSVASRLKFNFKALNNLRNQPNDKHNRLDFLKVSVRFYNLNDLENYKKVTKIIIKKAQTAKDDKFLAMAQSNMGDYFARKFVTDSAYYFYFKAQKIYTKLKDKQSVAKCLLNKAIQIGRAHV